MGRYVYESNNCVWKYVFAGQNSEQSLIPSLIGVGSMVYNKAQSHDTLILYCSKNTVKKLRNWVFDNCSDSVIQNCKEEIWPEKGPYFPYMVWAYAQYVEDQLKTRRGQRLRFWGEY